MPPATGRSRTAVPPVGFEGSASTQVRHLGPDQVALCDACSRTRPIRTSLPGDRGDGWPTRCNRSRATIVLRSMAEDRGPRWTTPGAHTTSSVQLLCLARNRIGVVAEAGLRSWRSTSSEDSSPVRHRPGAELHRCVSRETHRPPADRCHPQSMELADAAVDSRRTNKPRSEDCGSSRVPAGVSAGPRSHSRSRIGLTVDTRSSVLDGAAIASRAFELSRTSRGLRSAERADSSPIS